MTEPTPGRRRNMAAIKSKNTKPEKALRSALFRQGLRFRLHVKALPGSPDVVFPKYKAVVFMHGCFWHRHPGCRFAALPANNAQFWAEKFRSNVKRDQHVISQLLELNWRVAVVWECAIRMSPQRTAQLLESWLRARRSSGITIGESDVGHI